MNFVRQKQKASTNKNFLDFLSLLLVIREIFLFDLLKNGHTHTSLYTHRINPYVSEVKTNDLSRVKCEENE